MLDFKKGSWLTVLLRSDTMVARGVESIVAV